MYRNFIKYCLTHGATLNTLLINPNETNGSQGYQGYSGTPGIPGGYIAGACYVSNGEIEFDSTGQAITDIYALVVDDNPGEIFISPERGCCI